MSNPATTEDPPKSIGDNTDRGYNMQTISGKAFWPLKPYPEDFCIYDITHALSLQCRFGGHVKEFYSVAQHSLWVADTVKELYGPEFEFEGLMHDFTEGYISDLIRPVKYQCPEYMAIEETIYQAGAVRFGLPAKISREVKYVDNLAAWTEKRDLLVETDLVDWGPPMDPHPKIIVPEPNFKKVRDAFLDRYFSLGGT